MRFLLTKVLMEEIWLLATLWQVWAWKIKTCKIRHNQNNLNSTFSRQPGLSGQRGDPSSKFLSSFEAIQILHYQSERKRTKNQD